MRLTGLTLQLAELPLVTPFTTSFGTQTVRRALLLEAVFDIDGELVTGWGESVAGENPLYSWSTWKGRSTFSSAACPDADQRQVPSSRSRSPRS